MSRGASGKGVGSLVENECHRNTKIVAEQANNAHQFQGQRSSSSDRLIVETETSESVSYVPNGKAFELQTR